jgi:hypothetical protein
MSSINKLIKKAEELEGYVSPDVLPTVVIPTNDARFDRYGVSRTKGNINLSDEFLIRLATLNSSGVPVKDIADIFKLGKKDILKVLNSRDYAAVKQLLTKDIVEYARNTLATASIKAVSKMIELIDSEDSKIALRASIEVLNRVGIDAPKKIDVNVKHTLIQEMSNDQLESIISASKKAITYNKSDRGSLVDIDFEEVDVVDGE